MKSWANTAAAVSDRRILLLAILLISLAAKGSAQQAGEKAKAISPQAAALENTRWKVTGVPDDAAAKAGTKEFADTIEFKEGRFSSAMLSAKGFKPAAYRGDFEEKEAEFEVTQASETGETVIWLGEIRNDRVTGTLQWKKKDGMNLLFNFSGTKG